MPTMEMYCPSSKTKVQATIVRGEYVTSKGGSKRRVLYGEYNGKKCLPKTVKADVFAKYGFSAEESLVGTPSPSSPMDDAPALVPAPAEPSNESFNAEKNVECPRCNEMITHLNSELKYFCPECENQIGSDGFAEGVYMDYDGDDYVIEEQIRQEKEIIDGKRVRNAETFNSESPFDDEYTNKILSNVKNLNYKLNNLVITPNNNGLEVLKSLENDAIRLQMTNGQYFDEVNDLVDAINRKMRETENEDWFISYGAETFNSESGDDDDCDVCGIIKPLNAEGYCSECSHKSEYFNALSEDSYIVTKSAEMEELTDGVSAITNRFGDSVGIVQVDDSDDDIEDVDVQIIDDGMDIVYEDTLGAESFNADERIELQGDDGPSYTWENLYYNCPDCDGELSVVGGRGGTLAVCENGCGTEYPRNMLENFDEWHWFHNHGAHENARNDYKEPKESGGIPVCGICDFSQSYSPDNMVEKDDGSWKCQGCGEITESFNAESFNALDMELDRNDCCELWVEKMYDNGRIGFGEASNLLASIEMDGLKCSSLGSPNCSKENMGAESQGLSKSARTVIGLTSLGIGMALWKSEWINKLFDRK